MKTKIIGYKKKIHFKSYNFGMKKKKKTYSAHCTRICEIWKTHEPTPLSGETLYVASVGKEQYVQELHQSRGRLQERLSTLKCKLQSKINV